MNWSPLPSPYTDMRVWGTIEPPFQFVMSYDATTKLYAASSKLIENTGRRIDLGEYESRDAAEHACQNFLERFT